MAKCNCHLEEGACTQCLIDRNSYRYAKLLSKAKVLNWLNRQQEKHLKFQTLSRRPARLQRSYINILKIL